MYRFCAGAGAGGVEEWRGEAAADAEGGDLLGLGRGRGGGLRDGLLGREVGAEVAM